MERVLAIKTPTDGADEEAFPGFNQVGELTRSPMETGYGLSRRKQHMEEKIPRSVPICRAISFNLT